jgi:hypothetical protein
VLGQLAVYEEVNEANGCTSDFQMGMVETAVAPNAERAGVCLGSRAAVPRCGERVSLAPESRPIGSSDTHFLILLGRKRGWDFDRGQRRTAQVGVRCEDDELYGEKRGEGCHTILLVPDHTSEMLRER